MTRGGGGGASRGRGRGRGRGQGQPVVWLARIDENDNAVMIAVPVSERPQEQQLSSEDSLVPVGYATVGGEFQSPTGAPYHDGRAPFLLPDVVYTGYEIPSSTGDIPAGVRAAVPDKDEYVKNAALFTASTNLQRKSWAPSKSRDTPGYTMQPQAIARHMRLVARGVTNLPHESIELAAFDPVRALTATPWLYRREHDVEVGFDTAGSAETAAFYAAPAAQLPEDIMLLNKTLWRAAYAGDPCVLHGGDELALPEWQRVGLNLHATRDVVDMWRLIMSLTTTAVDSGLVRFHACSSIREMRQSEGVHHAELLTPLTYVRLLAALIRENTTPVTLVCMPRTTLSTPWLWSVVSILYYLCKFPEAWTEPPGQSVQVHIPVLTAEQMRECIESHNGDPPTPVYVTHIADRDQLEHIIQGCQRLMDVPCALWFRHDSAASVPAKFSATAFACSNTLVMRATSLGDSELVETSGLERTSTGHVILNGHLLTPENDRRVYVSDDHRLHHCANVPVCNPTCQPITGHRAVPQDRPVLAVIFARPESLALAISNTPADVHLCIDISTGDAPTVQQIDASAPMPITLDQWRAIDTFVSQGARVDPPARSDEFGESLFAV